jgi:hypothetical protein
MCGQRPTLLACSSRVEPAMTRVGYGASLYRGSEGGMRSARGARSLVDVDRLEALLIEAARARRTPS